MTARSPRSGSIADIPGMRVGHAGIARTVVPSHTIWDGDVVFALSTAPDGGAPSGERDDPVTVTQAGAAAADAMALAIVRAVRAARALPGCPAACDP